MKILCLPLLLLSAAIAVAEVDTGRNEKAFTPDEAAQFLSPGDLKDIRPGLPLPLGRSYTRDEVAGMIPYASPQQWKLKDGRTELFYLHGWEYRQSKNPNAGNLELWIQLRPAAGYRVFWYDARKIDPSEHARLCKNMWAMMWQLSAEQAAPASKSAGSPKTTKKQTAAPAPFQAYAHPVGREYGNDGSDHTLPPEPPVARPQEGDSAGALWPAGEEWTFADGHKEKLALYSWGWRKRRETTQGIEFRLLCCVAGTAKRRDVVITDLAPSEADKVNRALWRRFDQMRQPVPWAEEGEGTAHSLVDSPAALSARYQWGMRLPLVTLPLPGYELVKPLEHVDRGAIPVVNQRDFGSLASDCLPSSLAVIFLWWDEIQWLPLSRKGGFERKAEWLHRQFGKEMRTLNNRGTNWENAHEGLNDFALKQLDGDYAFQIRSDKDYSPENLARYATGTTGVVLSLSVWKGARYLDGHAVPLVSADAFGNCEIVTWGYRIRGKWEPVELPGRKEQAAAKDRKTLPAYELKIESVEPASKLSAEYRFILNAQEHDGLHVIIPNRRTAPAPPPAR